MGGRKDIIREIWDKLSWRPFLFVAVLIFLLHYLTLNFVVWGFIIPNEIVITQLVLNPDITSFIEGLIMTQKFMGLALIIIIILGGIGISIEIVKRPKEERKEERKEIEISEFIKKIEESKEIGD